MYRMQHISGNSTQSSWRKRFLRFSHFLQCLVYSTHFWFHFFKEWKWKIFLISWQTFTTQVRIPKFRHAEVRSQKLKFNFSLKWRFIETISADKSRMQNHLANLFQMCDHYHGFWCFDGLHFRDILSKIWKLRREMFCSFK